MTIEEAINILNKYPSNTELRLVSEFHHYPVNDIHPSVDMDTQIVSLDVSYKYSYLYKAHPPKDWVKEN